MPRSQRLLGNAFLRASHRLSVRDRVSVKFQTLMFGVGCGLLLADLVVLIVGAVHYSASGKTILAEAIILIGMLAIPFLVYPSLITLRDFTKLKL